MSKVKGCVISDNICGHRGIITNLNKDLSPKRLDLDSNPGPPACEASVLPFCHGDLLNEFDISWICERFENLPVTTFFVGNKQ